MFRSIFKILPVVRSFSNSDSGLHNSMGFRLRLCPGVCDRHSGHL